MDYVCFMVEPTGQLTPADHKYPNQPLYRRVDTGEEFPYLNCFSDPRAIGAMFWCDWLDEYGHRPDAGETRDWVKPETPRRYQPDVDGRVLGVITPGGTWIIDSRCSNCGSPKDNVHHCWVRHGT